jgi:hypothetical protein
MMHDSRLSRHDAVEFLSIDPKWSIERIIKCEPEPTLDALLSGLLPQVSQVAEYQNDTRVSEWMVRAIPYEEEEVIVRGYLYHLFSVGHSGRYNALMVAYSREKLGDIEIMDLLSIDPVTSLNVLENAPFHDSHQKWINWLIEKYPAAAGIVTEDSRLITPFGIAVVDFIERWDDGRVNHIRLGEPDYCLNVLVGSGIDRIRVMIDYHDMTISVVGETSVWKCGKCNYVHPQQNRVTGTLNAMPR